MDILPTLLSGIIAFAATISAGLFIKKLKKNIGTICAFSAGFFIALALFDLFPNILFLFPETQISIDKPLLIAIAGFFFLLVLDRGISRFDWKGQHLEGFEQRIGLISTLEFCSHGFVEGLAIGLGFQLQFGLGVFVAIAVISHDFCDGISTLALMLNSGNNLKSSMSMLFVDAIAPVFGAVVTFFVSMESFFMVMMLSFLAGSFLYIGGGSLLPDANRMNRPIVTIFFFILGFLLVLLLSVFL